MLVKKLHTRFIAALFVMILGLFTFVNGQSPTEPSKEEKKQAEKERKDKEKQVKEEAKRKNQEAEIQANLEALIRIGKNISYDRFKNTTTVQTKIMEILSKDVARNWGQVYVAMFAVYEVDGEFGVVPATVKLAFKALGTRRFFGTESDRTLNLIINRNRRVNLGTMDHNEKFLSNGYEEWAWTILSLSDFRSLVTSDTIEVQFGKVEWAFHPRHFQGLAALLEGLPQATATATTTPSKAIVPVHPHIGTWTLPMTRDGVREDWVLQIDGEPGALKGILKMGKGGQIALSNVLSGGSLLSGGAYEIVQGGMNMVTFSGQTSDNVYKGKITFWLLGKPQAPIVFEGKRTSVP